MELYYYKREINRQGPEKKGTTHTTTTPKVFFFFFFFFFKSVNHRGAYAETQCAQEGKTFFFFFHSSGGNDKRNQYVGAQCAIPDVVCAYTS